MTIRINRIIEDLADPSADIQMLALTMVPRLAPDMNITPRELSQLSEKVQGLAHSDNQDVVFLARKAANFLGQFGHPPQGSRMSPEEDPIRQSALKLTEELAGERDATRLATILSGLRRLQDRTVLDQVRPLLKHPDARVRANAVDVYEDIAGDADCDLLIPMMEDDNNRVRSNVIRVLGRMGYPKVKEALQKMLDSEHVSMRESALYAIARIPGLDAVDILGRVVDDPYEGVRKRLVECLKDSPRPGTEEILKRMLADADASVREGAARALAARGIDVAPLLVQAKGAAEPQAQAVVQDVQAVAPPSPGPPAAEGAIGPDAAEDELFDRHATAIAAELAAAERRAAIARILLGLGRVAMGLCRSGRLKDRAAVTLFYEATSLTRSIKECEARVAGGKPEGLGGELAETGVEHFRGRLKVAMIKLGKRLADLYRSGALTIPDVPAVKRLLDLL